jgi:hypothetical protein
VLGVLAARDESGLFLNAVTDAVAPGYHGFIDHPMDFGSIRGMLNDGKIAGPGEFATCVRRVFGNCLNWNFRIRGSPGVVNKAIRDQGKKILFTFEESWGKYKLADAAPALPRLRECLAVVDELLRLPSVSGHYPCAMENFMYPLPKYFGDFPAGYLEAIATPMDMSTVTSNLVEGKYKSPIEFKRDVALIFSNCEKWLHTEGAFYDTDLEQDAKALSKKFVSVYESIVGSNSSKRKSGGGDEDALPAVAAASGGGSKRQKVVSEKYKEDVMPAPSPSSKAKATHAAPAAAAATTVAVCKPTKIVLKEKYSFCVDKVKGHFILVAIDKVYTADYFLKAVDPTKYASYAETILHPMNLTMIEKKIRADRYPTFGDILKDVYLIRHNTYLYNTGTAGLEIRILVDHLVNNFCFLLTLMAKAILRMHDIVLKSSDSGGAVPAAVRASIEAAVNVMSPDFRLLMQVYHGVDAEAAPTSRGGKKGKTPAAPSVPELFASISDVFFSQPFTDGGIFEEYARPAPPSADTLGGLHAFFKYDKETLVLQAEEVPEPMPPPPTPVKAGAAKRQSGGASSFHAPVADAAGAAGDADQDYSQQPARGGGKGAGKGGKGAGKKRARDDSFDYAYDDAVADGIYGINDVGNSDRHQEASVAPAADLDDNNMDIIVSVARPPSEWEQSCSDILKRVWKHDFVDISRPAKAGNIVSNFMTPVVELYPQIADAYLELISTPMDFTIIANRLEDHGFLDCEDFYEKMILVFQNAIDYNQPHMDIEGDYAQRLVPRCLHMIKYVKWLCLELLPAADDSTVAEAERESLGVLRQSMVASERQMRVSTLRQRPIDNVKDCMALIKKFDHKKSAREYSYFSVPVNIKDVPNYSTFVRKPMDFSTVKEKLEFHRYPSYMAFIEDIQLIFANAKRFNEAFRENDAFSQTIYDAASMFEERLETLLNRYIEYMYYYILLICLLY